MKLRINQPIRTENGYIKPLSHLSKDKANQYAIFEVQVIFPTYYRIFTTTLNKSEIRTALGLPKKEVISIQ